MHTQFPQDKMGSSQNCFCYHRNRQLIVSLLFLLLSSLIQARFIAEGRAISKLMEASQGGIEAEKVVMKRSLIGSTPPKCERIRCGSCRHCEAIQVPVTTQAKGHKSDRFSAVAYYKGGDISNYKPMSWKCKCGDLIFNP